MSASAHRPSAEELKELVEIVRRDPGSSAFVDLGDALLALGRPRDAVEVGARGLKAAPDNVEGRLMVARAFVALHQWKQAQAELLKVVKTDRSHAGGFTLLGEVLMRRADYERALPVLQHAQNLDPANPAVLALLKRARAGQALDPPAPIPAPQSPSRSAQPALPRSRPAVREPSVGGLGDDEPTHVADDRIPGFGAAPLRDDPTEQVPMRPGTATGELDVDTGQIVADPDPSIRTRLPLPSEQRPAASPGQAPAVRPRVLSAEKPKDAAQASLRQSAAVGENYLNSLLTGGLLDLPNVRTPPDDGWDLRSGKRWGRSALRAMAVLFVIMLLGLGGGGYWYWYTEEQRTQDVKRHLDQAAALVATTTYDGLLEGEKQIRLALDRDDENIEAIARFAAASGLRAYLYGTDSTDAELSMSSAAHEIEAGEPGWRDVVIARAALVLRRLPDLEKPVDQLSDVRKQLDAYLETNPEDQLVRWLQGAAIMATGNRSGARSAFEAASAAEGPAVAAVSLADMLLDEGEHEKALALYETILERSEGHPLALIGRAMALAEIGRDSEQAMADLNVGLARDKGPRIEAYKKLALAFSRFADEYYEDFGESLDEAAALNLPESRYRARVALGRALQGRIADANQVRTTIRRYGVQQEPTAEQPEDEAQPDSKDLEPHPLVAIVDAEILLAAGLPGSALERLDRTRGPWARSVRGRALFELGDHEQAIAEIEEALEGAPKELEERGAQQLMLTAWLEAARLVSGDKKARRQADAALDKLGRFARNKSARVIHGIALQSQGELAEAADKLEASLDDITAANPNPLAYRAHTELGRIALSKDRVDEAVEHVDKALEINRRYLPAHGIRGRIALARGNADEAAEALHRAVADAAAADAWTELAYAEALLTKSGKLGKDERAAALAALERASAKGASGEPLERVVLLAGDEALAEELGFDLEKLEKKLKK